MEQQATNDSPDERHERKIVYTYGYRPGQSSEPADSAAAEDATHFDTDGCMVTYGYDAGGSDLITQSFHYPSAAEATPPCPDCSGTGTLTLLTTKKPCARCSGSGNSPA